MNSKERVRAAVQHKKTDYVPSTMQCVEAAWEKIRKEFGAGDNDQVMERLKIDVRNLDLPPYIGPELPIIQNAAGEKEYTHPFGYRYVQKWNGIEYNCHTVHRPLEGIETMEQFLQFQEWPSSDHFDYEAVKRFCDKHKDKAIRIGWPGPYQVFMEMYPPQDFYMLMADEPELVKAMLNRYSEFYLELYERMLIAGDGAIDLLRTCDDYGTQISLLFGPDMWEEYFAENTKRLVTLAHKYGCFFMQHSCGAIRGIIPKLVECGVDILDPIQKVVGMDPEGLKRDFGNVLSFQGGVDTQALLPFGTPEEVKKEAAHFIKALSQEGGYILGPSQDFEGDVPVENIVALYDSRELS